MFNRDSDKMIFERLEKEFGAARDSQTEGSFKYDVNNFTSFFFCWGGLVLLPLVALCERL
jgi:hypothetical protein